MNGQAHAPRLPLPPGLDGLIALGGGANRSLLYDKGMDRYSSAWSLGGPEKTGFLQAFLATFRTGDGAEFEAFRARRKETLERRGARTSSSFTQSRLVVGLGLPSPIETGFLFDRLTGCPYLPGSSVKGLLRATALLVRKGEIEGGTDFWKSNLERVFGPEISPAVISKTGEAIFYDAFPARWPEMELDVLTPHYGKHYRAEDVPADWDNPVPVPFLAIAAGVPFDFHVTAPEADFEEIRKLLGLGLDWLGIGAKKSAGYGVFGTEAPAAPAARPSASPQTERGGKTPPPPPAAPPKSEVAWSGAELSLRQGSLEARRGKHTATGRKDDLKRDLLDALKKHKTLRADLMVLKISNSEYRILEIKAWKKP